MLINRRYTHLLIFTILISVGGCFYLGNLSNEQRIDLSLSWRDATLDCKTTFHAGINNKTWFIEQFQFFISDIEIGSTNAGWQKIKLAKSPFQNQDTALIGTNCRTEKLHAKDLTNVANDANWSIKYTTPTDIILDENSRIRFTLGVPFEVNHLNPISQQSPLNLPSMFWIWQTGHKFLRLELAANHEKWLFHLGSTGCKSVSAMRAPEKTCLYPNRFNFELPLGSNAKKDKGNFALNVDLAELLKHVELSSSSSCQSEQNNKSCQQLFDNLLLNNKIKSAETEPGVFNTVNINHKSKGSTVE